MTPTAFVRWFRRWLREQSHLTHAELAMLNEFLTTVRVPRHRRRK